PFVLQVRNARSDKFRALVHDTVMARLAVAVPAAPRSFATRGPPLTKRAARTSVRPTDPKAPRPDGDRASAPINPETEAGDDAIPEEPGDAAADSSAPRRAVAARGGDGDDAAAPGTGVTGTRADATRVPRRSAGLVAVRAELGVSTTAR